MIRSIAAEVLIADVSHLIRPYGVREGATVLAETVGYIPDAVHLAVVDPGVGSTRRGVILEAAGSLLVGPDNGLLVPAAERLGGIESVWEIANRRLGLPERSSTFHGRDVFAPAAAHLATGTSPSEFGPRVPVGSLIKLPPGEVVREGSGFRGEVLLVDRFGNIQTSLRARELLELGLQPGDPVVVGFKEKRLAAVVRASYSFGEPGELQVILDSHASLSLCVNRGSAAALLGIHEAGSPVFVGAPEPNRPG